MTKDANICCGSIPLPAVVVNHRANTQYQNNSTPWKNWPTSASHFWQEAEFRALRHYMSCEVVLSNLCLETRQKALKALEPLKGHGSFIILKGGTEEMWSYYQSDTLVDVFKQEQFFRYLFGIDIPDVMGLVDIDSEEFSLFMPKIPESALQFLGEPDPFDAIKSRWVLDHIFEMTNFEEQVIRLDKKCKSTGRCYVLSGTNADSGLATKTTPVIGHDFTDKVRAVIDAQSIYLILEECRVLKTPLEQEMLRVCAYVSSLAHCAVMKNTVAGLEELYCEALFKSIVAVVGGARQVAYTCICASHKNAAILHYGHAGRPNSKFLRDGKLMLNDMGGIFPSGYVADITVTYPISGKFSDKQRLIYQTVLNANKAVFKQAKPGVSWIEMHELADYEILKGLQKAEILDPTLGELKLMELVKSRLGGYFMPHGLGHLVGLDTHDCGGHDWQTKETLKDKRGLRSLRCTRKLEAGMYITIEPGIYFVERLTQELKLDTNNNQHINFGILESYMSVGGVRIEDDVMITETGCVNYAVVPRNISDIEDYLRRS